MKEIIKKIEGVHAYLTTPFNKNNIMEINEEGFRKNISFLKDNNIKIITICGGTGEIWSLSINEHKKLLEIANEEKGNMFLIAGIPSGIKSALEISKYAQDIGIDALLIFPPIGPITEDGMYEYYKKIINSTNLPIQIFATGSILQCNLSTFRKIIELENVISIKYEEKNLDNLASLMHTIDKEVAWISGIDYGIKTIRYYFELGVKGFTCGIASIIPKLPLELYEAAINKDWKKVHEIEEIIKPIYEFRKKYGWISVIKASLDILGLAGGPPRPPLKPLKENEMNELKEMLNKYSPYLK
ncbi:MAG: dihydrodipicolinate synthase family protein [Nitrososphaerota archaeon]